MSTRFVVIVSLGIIILHQAGTALLIGGLSRPREALLVSGTVFLLYPLWRIARSSGRAEHVLRAGPAPALTYPLALGALLAAMPLALALGAQVAETPAALDEMFRRILIAHGPREWMITLLGAAVVPALGEELLFRGFLQRGLERRLRPLASIAIASLAFGAIHGPGRAAPATLLGALLGWIAWRTGSVRPGIVAHLLSNTAVILAANLGWIEGEGIAEPPALAAVLGGAALAAAFVLGIARISPGPEPPDPQRSDPSRGD